MPTWGSFNLATGCTTLMAAGEVCHLLIFSPVLITIIITIIIVIILYLVAYYTFFRVKTTQDLVLII